jgi:hypothetical protein
MPNPSKTTRRAEARNIDEETLTPSIISPTSAQLQEIARSPIPPHLDALIDLPWNPQHNREIDLWLWYSQQEFELAGGRE